MQETLAKIKVSIALLAVALCLILTLLFWRFYQMANPPFECGVKDEPQLFCGNVMSEEDSLGREIFKANCSRCHHTSDKKLTGPGFKDILDRVESEQWLRSYIGNSDSVIASGDAYAIDVRESFGKQEFNHSWRFTDEEWKSLLAYITEQPSYVASGELEVISPR